MKKFYLVSFLLLLGCSSTPQAPISAQVHFEKDQVLATSNDKPQPEWADETRPWVVKGDTVYSVGVTTLRGNERPEAGMRISENAARVNFAKTIQVNLEAIFQQSEENASFESTESKFISSEVSSLSTSAISIQGHWWKRYVQSEEDGSRKIYYKIYSLCTMPVTELKQAIFAAVHKGASEHKLSESFQHQVDAHLDKVMGIAAADPKKREPTSTINTESEVAKDE